MATHAARLPPRQLLTSGSPTRCRVDTRRISPDHLRREADPPRRATHARPRRLAASPPRPLVRHPDYIVLPQVGRNPIILSGIAQARSVESSYPSPAELWQYGVDPWCHSRPAPGGSAWPRVGLPKPLRATRPEVAQPACGRLAQSRGGAGARGPGAQGTRTTRQISFLPGPAGHNLRVAPARPPGSASPQHPWQDRRDLQPNQSPADTLRGLSAAPSALHARPLAAQTPTASPARHGPQAARYGLPVRKSHRQLAPR